MGSSTEHSAYGPTHNPWDLDRIPGGSGGGSAAAVASYQAPLAIGTDTGGSIRQPGAVTGTVGVKPTYGGVSRYGLVALANSLDQAGPVTRTVLDAALLHEVIGGHDPLDSTSIDQPLPALVDAARRGADGDLSGVRIGVVQGARRRGIPSRRARPLRGVGGADDQGGCGGRRGLLPPLRARPGDVLPDPAGRGVVQPRPLRRDAVRPAGHARRPPHRSAERRGRHARHPRGGLRRRGEATDHPRHLCPVQRLLRRLLRPGPEGAHADRARLRGGVRAGRRAGEPHRADHGVPDRGEGRRPARDVPQRPGHHPGQPVRRPRHLGAQRPGRRGRPAGRRPDPGPGDGRRPRLPRGRRARGAPRPAVGWCPAGPGPRAEPEPEHDRRPDVLRRGARAVRPGVRARGARRAEHRDQDVLRLPDGVRRRAEHPDLPDLPGPAGLDAGGQREGDRVRDPDRPGAELRDRRVVPVRPEELLLPRHAEELPDLAVRRADRLRGIPGRRGAGGRGRARDVSGGHRAGSHGGGHRQVAARRRQHRPHPRRRLLPGRLQPRRHPTDRDRHQARGRHRREGSRGRPRLRRTAARDAPRARA